MRQRLLCVVSAVLLLPLAVIWAEGSPEPPQPAPQRERTIRPVPESFPAATNCAYYPPRQARESRRRKRPGGVNWRVHRARS